MRLIDADRFLRETRFQKGVYPQKTLRREIGEQPTVAAVPVEQYKELMAEYNQLRENFVDFFCSGSMNPAPYCLNSCKECTDNRGWCDPSSDKCNGFNPADIII